MRNHNYSLMAEGDASAGGTPVVAPVAAPVTPEPAAVVPPADGKPAPLIAADAPTFDAAAAKTFLTEKGEKAEDLDKLSPEDLQAKFDAANKAPEPLTPEKIEFKLPDGMIADEKFTTDFKALMADEKLSRVELAQKLVDLQGTYLADAAKAFTKQSTDLWHNVQADWQKQVKDDAEIGGAKYDATLSAVKKAVTDFGGKEAKAAFEALDVTGAGNNPAIIRVLYRMAAQLVEGGHVSGNAPGTAGDEAARTLTSMYPSASKAR